MFVIYVTFADEQCDRECILFILNSETRITEIRYETNPNIFGS